jgi:hypothetical protein
LARRTRSTGSSQLSFDSRVWQWQSIHMAPPDARQGI